MDRTELETAFAEVTDQQLADLITELSAEELEMWDTYEMREALIDAWRDGTVGFRQQERSVLLNEIAESYADRDVRKLVKRALAQ